MGFSVGLWALTVELFLTSCQASICSARTLCSLHRRLQCSVLCQGVDTLVFVFCLLCLTTMPRMKKLGLGFPSGQLGCEALRGSHSSHRCDLIVVTGQQKYPRVHGAIICKVGRSKGSGTSWASWQGLRGWGGGWVPNPCLQNSMGHSWVL